jgi:hypothetical protein
MNNTQLAALLDNSLDFFSCNDCPVEEGSDECERGCIPQILEFLNKEIAFDGAYKKYKLYKIAHSGRKGPRDAPLNNCKYDGIVDSIVQSYDIRYLHPFQRYHFKFLKTKSPYESWITSEVVRLIELDEGIFMLETVNTLYYFEEIK